jgi:hypothetical protein
MIVLGTGLFPSQVTGQEPLQKIGKPLLKLLVVGWFERIA